MPELAPPTFKVPNLPVTPLVPLLPLPPPLLELKAPSLTVRLVRGPVADLTASFSDSPVRAGFTTLAGAAAAPDLAGAAAAPDLAGAAAPPEGAAPPSIQPAKAKVSNVADAIIPSFIGVPFKLPAHPSVTSPQLQSTSLDQNDTNENHYLSYWGWRLSCKSDKFDISSAIFAPISYRTLEVRANRLLVIHQSDTYTPRHGLRNDLDRLDDHLLSDDSPAKCMTLSDLDGFLHGVVCCPVTIPTDEWMSFALGGAELETIPRWVLETIADLYMVIAGGLASDPAYVEPMFWEGNDGAVIAMDWCEGFMDAIKLRPKE